MSRRLIEALARAGVAPLYKLAGREAVDLLERIDSRALSAHGLAALTVDLHGSSEALQRREVRDVALGALRRDEADALCSLLGIDPLDPFGSLQAVDFDRSESRLAILHSFFAVPLNETDQDEADQPASVRLDGPYTLFPHQRRAALAVREGLRTPHARVLLHMPTGAGKTRTALTSIVDLLRSEADGRIVIWLAHSEELCDQAFEEAATAWSRLGSRELTIHRHYGAHRVRDFREVDDGLIVAGLSLLYQNSLKRQGEFLDLARRTRLVVMDEAHQATAPTYSHLINLLQRNRSTGVLGLSATPGRSLRDVGADIGLADFFGRRKVRLEVEGYPNPIDYLVAQGYLARMEFVPLPFGGNDVELSVDEAERLRQGFDLPARVLQDLAADDARNLMIVDMVAKEVAAGGSVILFALSVAHAALLASVLRLQGVSAAAITSGTPTEVRRRTIQRYKDRQGIDVLCNYGVLTTGFDAPRTNVAFIARPTTTVVLYSQMIGRAARGPAAGGNETCRILTVVDRVPGFRSLVDGFEFWDDIWEGD